MPVSVIFAFFLSIIGIAYHNDNTVFMNYILLYFLCGILAPATVIIFKTCGMLFKEGSEYPFDNRVIGKTFNTVSSKSFYFHKGVKALHKGDFNTALDIFGELEETKIKDSWKAVLYYFHGRTYQLMGYPTNAAKYYIKSIDMRINIDDIYILTSRCYTYTGCYSEAIEFYEKLLKKNTLIDYVLTDMGLAYLKGEMPDKALECFRRSVTEGKNYAFALGGCSLAFLQMKNIDKSREYYSRALINNMDDVDGFKEYYCRIAEAAGLLEQIDPNMKTVNADNEASADYPD